MAASPTGNVFFGMAPKLHIGAVGNPFLGVLRIRLGAYRQTRNLISAIYEARQASLKADFQNKLNTTLFRRARGAEMRIFAMVSGLLTAGNRKNKEEGDG